MKILTNMLTKTSIVAFVFVSSTLLNISYAQSLPDFRSLVKDNSKAVVNISTTQKIKKRSSFPKGFKIPDLPEDNPLSDFLERFLGHGGIIPDQTPEEREAESLGSGFIISKDGYIITNNHVIQDANEIIVKLGDQRELKAELIGSDERSDIAVLKIDADNLPIVKIGKSKQLEVGEWVLAIGSPFGFDHSVTAGIVSAKGRALPSENYVPFIQTDVAINPGNSGGPLFNLDGEVVGVNSQIYSRTGGFMGLSFAIPIDVAVQVVEQLKANGRVSRGWLGVLIQDVTRELAQSFSIKRPHGALIAKVLPESPAGDAGFEVGDVVMDFNGHAIERSSDLPPIVGMTPIGKKVPVQILRNGKQKTLQVVIAELPEDDDLKIAANNNQHNEATDKRLGITVSNLTTEMREMAGIDEVGVMVADVQEGDAFKAGIHEGDLILMLNNTKILNVKQFKEVTASLPSGSTVPVLVQRQGNPVFLALKIK